ncbi:uncharacterized protein V1518DRAFT_410897 [Limtongia smithiae]|uniref:uncharacterized protein n=1 Tax=Limtongia smithiae TaxID=1125753 RepID=UPI0034CEE884
MAYSMHPFSSLSSSSSSSTVKWWPSTHGAGFFNCEHGDGALGSGSQTGVGANAGSGAGGGPAGANGAGANGAGGGFALPEYLHATCYADRYANFLDHAAGATVSGGSQAASYSLSPSTSNTAASASASSTLLDIAGGAAAAATQPLRSVFDDVHSPYPYSYERTPLSNSSSAEQQLFMPSSAPSPATHYTYELARRGRGAYHMTDDEFFEAAQSYTRGGSSSNIGGSNGGAKLLSPPPPLPSAWSSVDISNIMKLSSDKLEVTFAPPSGTKPADQEVAAAVRSNYPIPPQCGFFYFEVQVLSRGKNESIGIGFCGPDVGMNKILGWVADSWAYHGDDGHSFACHTNGKPYGPLFTAPDVIGCGINLVTRTAFYTKNGMSLGVPFRDIRPASVLYPAIGMKNLGECVRANFGQSRFMFDVDSYMREEKAKVYSHINEFTPPLEMLAEAPTASASPDAAVTQTIHRLIMSYLAHSGYVDSVHAFSQDVRRETISFGGAIDGDKSGDGEDLREDLEAVHRQKIRVAVLEGDIDAALKKTQAYFPRVLAENPEILFQLKCRKFVELMRKCALASAVAADTAAVAQVAEVAAIAKDGDGDVDMDTAEVMKEIEAEEAVDSAALLSEALLYGQKLHEEYREATFTRALSPPESTTPPAAVFDIQQALNDIFALMAYPDPLHSPVAHLLEEQGRVAVAEELNSAILVSQGKSSIAPLERLIQHTSVLIQELAEKGGQSAFVNVGQDFLAPP